MDRAVWEETVTVRASLSHPSMSKKCSVTASSTSD
jgi:hypothetical protein